MRSVGHTKIYRHETIKQNWTFRAKSLRREVNSTSNITNFPITGLRLKLFLFSGSKGSYIYRRVFLTTLSISTLAAMLAVKMETQHCS